MSDVGKELDRLRHEAWRDLAADVRRTGEHTRSLGMHFVKRHPAWTLGAGAVVGALVVARITRSKPVPAPAPRRRRRAARGAFTAALASLARMWLMEAMATGPQPASNGTPESGDSE